MDGGNFAAPSEKEPYEHWEKTTFIWDMMARLGYDAVTPGDLELVMGLEGARELFGRHPDIQVVSANIRDKSGNLVFPRYTVIEKDGVRFGVTGVTSEAYYTFNMTRGRQKKDDFAFDSETEAMREVIPELQAKCDLVVALLHQGPGDAQRLLDEIDGIDVVVVGHNPGYMFNPDRVNNTLVIRTGQRGQYFSVLELTLDDSMRILDYNGEGKPLDTGVAKDENIEPVVKAWEDDFKRRAEQAKRKEAVEQSQLQGTEKYIGAEMCARCHVEQYARWVETAHASAYETLVEGEQETVGECLECHVVGYGQHSGYEIKWLTDANGEKYASGDTRELRGVQCESCHGMGTFHGTENLVEVPGENVCRTCHQGEFDKGFDYEKALAEGAVH